MFEKENKGKRHIRSYWDVRWEGEQGWRGKGFVIISPLFTGSSGLCYHLPKDIHVPSASGPADGLRRTATWTGSARNMLCAFTRKQLLRVSCCFSPVFLSQSLAWVIFPAIFLSDQPYNFIVIILCGLSLDPHVSCRLGRAKTLLVCPISGFKHLSEPLLIRVTFWDICTERKSSTLFILIFLFICKCVHIEGSLYYF